MQRGKRLAAAASATLFSLTLILQITELSSKLKDADQLLSRKEETLDSETRKLQLAQKRLDDIKAQQKEWKSKRDALKDAKKKFEKEENDASNRADDLKVARAWW